MMAAKPKLDTDTLAGATVRIPAWVLDEVEEHIQQHRRGERPTRGELLASAWKRYQRELGKSGKPQVDLTAEENACLALMVKVLRGKDASKRATLKSMLETLAK